VFEIGPKSHAWPKCPLHLEYLRRRTPSLAPESNRWQSYGCTREQPSQTERLHSRSRKRDTVGWGLGRVSNPTPPVEMAVSLSSTVTGTTTRFHQPGCRSLANASKPRQLRIFETLIGERIYTPCQICWPRRTHQWWISQLRSVHQNCAPSVPYHPSISAQQAQPAHIGRPRSLSETALVRVLQLHEAGFGYRTITRRMKAAGTDTTLWSVRRAVLGLPPYQRGDSTRTQ